MLRTCAPSLCWLHGQPVSPIMSVSAAERRLHRLHAWCRRFASIPDAFWWCIVTFLTVGYGDVNPISPIGKGVATATMVIGIFFLAMPLAITGAAFVDAWKKLDERAKLIEEEVARRKNGESSASVFNKERVDDAYQNLLQVREHCAACAAFPACELSPDSRRQQLTFCCCIDASCRSAWRICRPLNQASTPSWRAQPRRRGPRTWWTTPRWTTTR